MKKVELSKEKGITLIALVITIIVMLILVAVTINMAVNGGLFGYAQNAASETDSAIKNEKSLSEVPEDLSEDELIDYYVGPLSPTLYGDANVDGEVTGRDATLVAKYFAGNAVLTRQGKANADVNLDGEINQEDAELISQAAVGSITLPQPKQ